MRWVLLARGTARFDLSSLVRPRARFDGLLALFTLAGCYAVPSEHDITPRPPADAGSTEDAEADPDAAAEADADAGEGEVDGAMPNDAGMDARVDAGKDGAVEAGSEAGPADTGQEAEASVCGTCPDAAPACAVTTAQCVACVADDAGACVGKLCSSNNTCIECRENAHCKKPDASVCNSTGTCVPCAEGSDTQCSHIADKGVCSAGQCIQCRKDKAAACVIGGTQYVCDPTTRACDPQRKARSKTLCNACVSSSDSLCKDRPDCVSDDECQVGQACVTVPAGAGKKVCQEVIGSNSCAQPYTSATTNAVPSADGPSVRVCTFAAMTTCRAHADYRVRRCGTPDSANPAQDLPGSGNDTICGEPNLSDGYCTYSDATKQYLCTVPCNATYLDCPGAWLPEHCDTLSTPDRCRW